MRALSRHFACKIIALFSVTACLASAVGANAAAPGTGRGILKRVPADALWFVVANDISGLNTQLTRMRHSVSLPPGPDAITNFAATFNLNVHALNLHGSFVLIKTPYKSPQPGTIPDPYVELFPSRHLRQLFANAQLTRHRGGIFQLHWINGMTDWAAQHGPFVVRASSRQTLKAFLAARTFWTGRLSTAEVAALGQPGICMLLNARATRKVNLLEIAGQMDRLKNQIAQSKNSAAQLLPFFYALSGAYYLFEKTNIILLVTHPHARGLTLQTFINFDRHSAFATLLPTFPALGARPLAGLPDGQFAVAGAMASDPEALTAWCESFDSYTSKHDSLMGSGQSAFLKPFLATMKGLTHPVTRSMEMLAVNMKKPPFFRAVSISTSADMPNHFADHMHSLLDLSRRQNGLMKNKGVRLHLVQAKSALRIAGVSFSGFTIQMAPAKAGAGTHLYARRARKFERMVVLGSNGLHVQSGLLGRHMISGANVPAALLAAAVATVRHNRDPLDHAPNVRAMRKYMLKNRFFVAFSQWLALSMQSQGPVLRLKVYLPAASLRPLAGIMMLEMLRD